MILCRNNILSAYFIVALLLAAGCKKDNVEESTSDNTEECDCTPIPTIGGFNTGYNYVHDDSYYFWPQYNPNNDQEILYCEYSTAGNKIMYKYNLSTNQKDVIYEGLIWSAPEWGKQDWIVFTHADGNIYKIMSNGTGLAQVTAGGSYFHPKFNEDGNRIYSYHAMVDANLFYSGVIWDLNGNLLDSIPYAESVGDWRKQSNLATRVGSKLYFINPNTHEILNQYNFVDNSLIGDFVWLSANEGFCVNGEGIFKMDVWTNQVEKIKCACSSRTYNNGTVNSNSTKIIYNEVNLSPIDETTLLENSRLIIMNIDGTGFEEIIIQ